MEGARITQFSNEFYEFTTLWEDLFVSFIMVSFSCIPILLSVKVKSKITLTCTQAKVKSSIIFWSTYLDFGLKSFTIFTFYVWHTFSKKTVAIVCWICLRYGLKSSTNFRTWIFCNYLFNLISKEIFHIRSATQLWSNIPLNLY